MLKKELRKQIRKMKQQFTEDNLRELSLPALSRLIADRHVTEAKTILIYYSLSDEVFTHDIIDELIQLGKTVLLPKVISGEEMELREYTGRKDLEIGSFGIMEPVGRLFTDYDRIDLAVVPGMAFDNQGNRLGRGKGYYDRMLTKLTKAYKIGICFDFQKVNEVPSDAYDIKMNTIISATRPTSQS